MIQLLFMITITLMGLSLTLVFSTPVRKLVTMGLDKMKQGRGPLVAKSVAGTLSVVFLSSLYSVVKIQKRSIDAGTVHNPTDEVLLAYHLLEVALMGFSLFLVLMIDRLHYYIKELRLLRTSLEAVNGRLGYDSTSILMEKSAEMLEEEQKRIKSERKKTTKKVGFEGRNEEDSRTSRKG